MKNKVNIFLLLMIFLGIILSIVFKIRWDVVSMTNYAKFNLELGLLSIFFPVVPAFFFQCLVCRLTKKRLLQWMPSIILLILRFFDAFFIQVLLAGCFTALLLYYILKFNSKSW